MNALIICEYADLKNTYIAMRKWRPSKAQKADFIEKCNERQSPNLLKHKPAL